MNYELREHLKLFQDLADALTKNLEILRREICKNGVTINTQLLVSTHAGMLSAKKSLEALLLEVDGCEEEARVELAVRKFLVPNPNKTENKLVLDKKIVDKFLSRFNESEKAEILASINDGLGEST